MEWVQMIVVPILIAIVPCVLTYLGTRAQIKADLQKTKIQLDEQNEENQKQILDAIAKRNVLQDEALKCLIRTEILNSYFKHQDKEKYQLTQWESENLHKLYESYQSLEGNSFVKDVVDRMSQWEIIKN